MAPNSSITQRTLQIIRQDADTNEYITACVKDLLRSLSAVGKKNKLVMALTKV